eukprot:746474-Hanusia_phi.AAC.2
MAATVPRRIGSGTRRPRRGARGVPGPGVPYSDGARTTVLIKCSARTATSLRSLGHKETAILNPDSAKAAACPVTVVPSQPTVLPSCAGSTVTVIVVTCRTSEAQCIVTVQPWNRVRETQ